MTVVPDCGLLWLFVSVHVSTDPRCHPRDRRSLPVPSASARGRVPQGECGRLPRQPRCALEPRHWHRESPENGRTEGVAVFVKSSAFYFIYSIVQSLSSPHKLLILSFYDTELQLSSLSFFSSSILFEISYLIWKGRLAKTLQTITYEFSHLKPLLVKNAPYFIPYHMSRYEKTCLFWPDNLFASMFLQKPVLLHIDMIGPGVDQEYKNLMLSTLLWIFVYIWPLPSK